MREGEKHGWNHERISKPGDMSYVETGTCAELSTSYIKQSGGSSRGIDVDDKPTTNTLPKNQCVDSFMFDVVY